MAKITKHCKHCGKKFSLIPAKSDRMYCSMKCYHADRKVTLYQHKCEACGKSFENKRPEAKFCSRKCMSQGFENKETRTCPGCQKTFWVIPASTKEFCTRKCRDEHKSQQAIKTGDCKICNKKFTYQVYFGEKQYCSPECAGKSRQRRIQKRCESCGSLFTAGLHRSKAKFCSKKCADNAGRVTKTCPQCNKKFVVVAHKSNQACCSKRCANKHKKRTYIEITVSKWLADLNLPFVEQHRIGTFTCDFFVCDKLVIEVDGTYWHSLPKVLQRDRLKDKMIKSKGFIILRLPEKKINESPEWCKQQILNHL